MLGNTGDRTISVIDVSQLQVIHTIWVPQCQPLDLAINPGGSLLYAMGEKLVAIDIKNDYKCKVIPI